MAKTTRKLLLVLLGVAALAGPGRAQFGQDDGDPVTPPELVATMVAAADAPCVPTGSPWSRLDPSIRRDLAGPLDAFEARGFASRHYRDQLAGWKAGKPARSFAQYFFDELLDAGGRRHLLLLYAKVLNEGFWDRIAVLFPAWGAHGSFFFLPRDRAALEADLEAKGYDCSWLAAGSTASWGVRSGKRGCQLHLRHFLPSVDFYAPIHALDPGFIYLHVDMNNPGVAGPCTLAGFLNPLTVLDPRRIPAGWQHYDQDHRKSGQYSFEDYRRAIAAQGIYVPDVDAAPCEGAPSPRS